jgi:gluconokinase
VVIILMGVAGSGKTAIGQALAAALGWRFEDADTHHPASNVAKMRRGMPLSDADRAPWLASLRALVVRALDRREPLVLACSALKEAYRRTLAGGLRHVRFVHLTADEATLRRRLESRPAHFFGPSLLGSQLAALEVPRDALTIDTTAPPEQALSTIRYEFGL